MVLWVMSNGYHVAGEKKGTLSFVTVWLNLEDRHRNINVNTVSLWDSFDWSLTHHCFFGSQR